MTKYIYDNTLQGKHKAFDQNLYNAYDIPARDKIKLVLGEYVCDNPDQYKQDLILNDEKCKYKYIELQVCTTWLDTYPHEKVFIYERKKHYGEDTLFITLNKELTKGYIFDSKSIDNMCPRRLRKYSREFVYDVPWNRVLPVVIDKLNIDVLRLY